MPEIPPHVVIKSTIKPGSVYFFPEETFHVRYPHFFIVLNTNPLTDTAIILVCASSEIDKVKQRRRLCPVETLVELTPHQYPGFIFNSIIDCNFILEKTLDQLVEKLSSHQMQLKLEMDAGLVNRIREGVLKSNLVEQRIKALIDGE